MKKIILLSFVLIALIFKTASGQTPKLTQQELFAAIAKLDSAMFAVVYTCHPDKEKYFTPDLEFYHDKSGLTRTSKALMEISQKNFCDRKNYKLRRELVPGTLKVFPMDNYGAIQSGEHYFFETVDGGKEKKVGVAKFTHLWQFANGEWRISRVLSYDHQPAKD
jgi:hypothetical protein